MQENPPGIIFEKGSCNMCGRKLPEDTSYYQILCSTCKENPDIITGDKMIKELEKDKLLTPMKPSPYI